MTALTASRTSLLPALLLLVLSAVPLAATQRPAAHSAHHPAEGRGPDNVLLITIDTLRADHLGCYGYKSIRTPTIDALARDGVLFPMAISQVPLTLPEHVAILTGTYPFHNQVQDFTAPPLSDKFRTVAEAFHDHGYASGAVRLAAITGDRIFLIYNGTDDHLVYRMGWALFDKNNPAKVLARADVPIFQPEEEWEKVGQVPNVVFVEGLVRTGKRWLFYYGGADKYVGVAEAQARPLAADHTPGTRRTKQTGLLFRFQQPR